jgi:hypothetical protein
MAVACVGQRDRLGARYLSLPGECPPVHIVVAKEFFSQSAIIAPMLWAHTGHALGLMQQAYLCQITGYYIIGVNFLSAEDALLMPMRRSEGTQITTRTSIIWCPGPVGRCTSNEPPR